MLAPPARTLGVVHVDTVRCKGCELCVEYCPTDLLATSRDFNAGGYHYPEVGAGECICCQLCSTICPEFAIFATPAPTLEVLR